MDPKQELSLALLRCRTLETGEGRQRLVRDLPSNVASGVGESLIPQIHIRNIIDRCADRPGGLRTLMDALRVYEEGSRPFLKVLPLVLGIELLEMVRDQLNEQQWTDFFQSSLPRLHVHREAKTSWEQIKLLWQMRSLPNEASPILRFVDQIVRVAAWDAWELSEWRTWAMQQPSLHLQEGTTTSTAIDETPTSHPYLTIVVKPLPKDGGTVEYEITVYLWTSHRNVFQLETSGRLTHMRREMPGLVASALGEAQRLLQHRMPDLVLEFCLPYELLSEDVDQLSKPDSQVGERCLGIIYPVVVRPFYRLMDSGEARGWWQGRWRSLKGRMAGQTSDEALVWICSEEDQRLDTFIERLGNRSQRICYVGLPFTPTGQMGQDGILTEMMRTGIPVAIWPRFHHAAIDPLGVRPLLDELLCDEQVADLPYYLQTKRLTVHHTKNHPGNHMTLLWDDADRIPPPFPGGARLFRPSDL